MSTKIYNGYRIPKYNIKELLEYNKSISVGIIDITNNLYNELFMYKVISIIDDLSIGNHEEYNSLHGKYKLKSIDYLVERSFSDRMSKILSTNERDPEVDFQVKAHYFPIKGKLLVLFETEQPEIVSYWKNLLKVEDYHYQNQCDKPKHITARQWKRRESDWNEALSGDWNISSCLSYNFVHRYSIKPDYNRMIDFIPSFEKRLDRLSERRFIDEYYNDMITNMSQADIKEKGINIVMEAIRKYNKREEDEFVMGLINTYKEEYKPLLVKNFTKESLIERMKNNEIK